MAGRQDRSLKAALTGPVGGIEPQFLHDLGPDRLVSTIFALAAELHVMRDRVGVLETLLERSGVLAPGAIDAFMDSPERSARQTAEVKGYVARVLGELNRSSVPGSRVGRAKKED